MMAVVGLSLPEATLLKKGDDVAADCDILRNGGFLHYLVGLFV